MRGRSVLLVLGVLVLQTAFVLSCVGAFRDPVPHRIPLAVTDPTTRIADDTFYQLALLPGEPVDPVRVADEAAALDRIHSREVDGALVLSRSGTADLLLVAGGAGPLLAKELATHVIAAEGHQGARSESGTWCRSRRVTSVSSPPSRSLWAGVRAASCAPWSRRTVPGAVVRRDRAHPPP